MNDESLLTLASADWFCSTAVQVEDYTFDTPLDADETRRTLATTFRGTRCSRDSEIVASNIRLHGKRLIHIAYLGGKQRHIARFSIEKTEEALRFADAFTSFFAKYRTKRREVWNFSAERGAADCENEPRLRSLLVQMEALFLEHALIKPRTHRSRTTKAAVEDVLNKRLGNLEARLNIIAATLDELKAIQIGKKLDELNYHIKQLRFGTLPGVVYDSVEKPKTPGTITIKPIDE